MSTRFIQDGRTIDYIPSTDIAAGTVVVQGDLVGVANLDIAAGNLGALTIEGVFEFPKATGSGTEITVGTICYWKSSTQQATTNPENGANKKIGKCIQTASNDEAKVRIKLDQ